MSVWETLSKIDCSQYVERKGNLTYLSWAWAWGITKQNFPDANYEMQPHETFPDGTVMVRCKVTIQEVTHEMWLPVMNHRNQAISNPDAFQINTSMMRCLTKCLAMFGLGHYIYAGEDVPREEKPDPEEEYQKLVDANLDSLNAIREGIASGDLSTAHEAWAELDEETKVGLWKAPSKGGWFTTDERTVMKSTEFRQANGV